jgi:hypothetical protein
VCGNVYIVRLACKKGKVAERRVGNGSTKLTFICKNRRDFARVFSLPNTNNLFQTGHQDTDFSAFVCFCSVILLKMQPTILNGIKTNIREGMYDLLRCK